MTQWSYTTMELFNEMKISDLTRMIMKLNNKRDFALILELWRFNIWRLTHIAFIYVSIL